VVVGAGPSGSSAAAEIAKAGLKVLMIEKDEYPGKNNVCGGALARKFFRDLGLDYSVVDKRIFGRILFFPSGAVDRRSADFDSVSFQRSRFDYHLARSAIDVGARSATSSAVFRVALRADCAQAFFRRVGTGNVASVNADLVIFADGPASLARRQFGLGLPRALDRMALGMIYELEWKNNPVEHFEFYFGRDIVSYGYGWIFPKKHVMNVGVACLLSKLERNVRSCLDYFAWEHPIASRRLAGRRIVRSAAALIPLAPARRIVRERVMLVGDAAGLVDPLWGGGIAYAIQSGRIAGQTAVRAIEQEDFSTGFLKRYEREWRRSEDGRALSRVYALSRMALGLSSIDPDAYIRLQRGLVGISSSKTFGIVRKIMKSLSNVPQSIDRLH